MNHTAVGTSGIVDTPVRSILVNACFVLCFLSYVRFFPIAAENQPMASAIALLIVTIYGVPRDGKTYTLLTLCALVLLYTMLSVAIRNERASEVMVLGIGYLLPILIFLALWRHARSLSVSVYIAILGTVFVIGAVQHYEFLSALRPLLDGLL